jgi:hypothetical protein
MAKKEQFTLQVGRTDQGHVVIAKNQEPVVIMPPRVALQMAAQIVKHASVIVSGAQMIDDAIAQLDKKLQSEDNGDGDSNITPMPPPRIEAAKLQLPDESKAINPETPPEQEA